MKKIIVGNWKMNPASQKEAKELFDAVKHGIKDAKAEVVICPPYIYVSELKGLTLGAQNVSLESKGAFTGQISAAQLKDLGIEYVIVGHSEVRKHLGETNGVINKKIQAVLEAGMTPILCIDNEQQIPKEIPSQVIVAYEPLWAIGTGKNCEPADVEKMAGAIRQVAGKVRVLYGGSVNSENAKKYLDIVDGLLVGGASLKADEFVKIVESASV
jgi:triosephosphate isomerase